MLEGLEIRLAIFWGLIFGPGILIFVYNHSIIPTIWNPEEPPPPPGKINAQQSGTENSFTCFKMQLLAIFPRENGLKQRRNT